jgi:hypothetical protein
LLLRVVAVAGAGAILGVAACSSGSEANGSVVQPPPDGGHDATDDHVVVGTVPNPDGGHDASDDHVVNGVVDGSPGEGGEDANEDHVVVGVVPLEAGEQDGPVGVVVHPDSGAD